MQIVKMIGSKMASNNYLVIDGEDAILIDASVEISVLKENLKVLNKDTRLKAIFLTHEHFDHISTLDNIIAKYKVPVYIHEMGKNSLYKVEENLSILDEAFKIKEKSLVKKFKDGEEINVGKITVKCFHTPGHSLGSSCFVIEDNMFTGDTVFKVGVGRTDMFGGDERIEVISLRKIGMISEGINSFYPGHGDNFSREELVYNISHYAGE